MNQEKKELINEIYKEFSNDSEMRSRIEATFPNLFPKKDLYDKWITDDDQYGWLVNYEKNGNTYGFDVSGTWFFKETMDNPNSDNNNRLASHKEIESALIKEAKKRGFEEGVEFIGECDNYKLKVSINRIFWFNSNRNELCVSTGINTLIGSVIFKEGKWATVLPQKKKMTLDDIEKELGYKVEIING